VVPEEKPGEVESEGESEWSGLGGRRTGLETGGLLRPGEIQELLREQNGHLKRIAQGLDRGSKPVVRKLRILL